jgi:hypothetical protein
MTLSELSVRRPVFGGMLVLGLVVLGAVSLGRLEMQLDPDVEFPFVYVVTELRGASPETVEREVSDVLEEQINSIEGIRTLSSVSSQGLSRISIEFGMQYDVDVKAQEVRDKVDLARPALPRDVEDPLVQKFDLNAIAFLTVVLGGPASSRTWPSTRSRSASSACRAWARCASWVRASGRSASGSIRCVWPGTAWRSRTSPTLCGPRTRSSPAGGSRAPRSSGRSPRRARRGASPSSAS